MLRKEKLCLRHSFEQQVCTAVHPETNVVIDNMHRYTMDSQYENVNVADFDVVRSTQFVDDYPRGVRALFSWDFELVNCNVGNSGEMYFKRLCNAC